MGPNTGTRSRSARSLIVLLGAAVLTAAVAGLAEAGDPARGVPTEETLESTDPAAAELFDAGYRALHAGDLDAAEARFTDVLTSQPDFAPAMRNLSTLQLMKGNRPAAVALAREAVTRDGSWENRVALASALAARDGGQPPPSSDLLEARRVANQAAVAAPNEPGPAIVMCEIAIAMDDLRLLESFSKDLERTAPQEVATWVYRTLAHMSSGHRDQAERALQRARNLGLDEETHRSIRSAIQQSNPVSEILRYGGWGLAGWGALMLLLVAAGAALSAATLHRVRTLKGRGFTSGTAEGLDGMLRRLYGVVLWLSCLFFYVSVPLLVIVVLAAGGALLYLMLAMGHVPIKFALIVLVLTVVTVGAVVRSLLVRGAETDPGRILDLDSEPRLRDVLVQVAARVGTRPVDAVYLTPGVDMAVMERGGLMRQIRGASERCLILGIGVLEGFGIRPFKAVLAHEYGHFSNRDTAGGGFALAVRRSIFEMAQGLAQSGAAGWFNPAWLFVNGFHRVFLLISQGASRLQEILADRWAVVTYGAEAFVDGLRHVIDRSIRFDAVVQGAAVEAAEQGRAVANLYLHHPAEPVPEARIEQAVSEALNAEPSPYDSHPSPRDRFSWARAIEAPAAPPEAGDELPAWSLFDHRESLELEMTGQVSQFMAARYGIDLVQGRKVAEESEAPASASD
jgi:Zn-dependent protease with chaperone function